MAVTREEYAKLLARPMAGKSRDERVRAANIAAGYGSSTAQRFLHSGAGGGATGGSNFNLPRSKGRGGGAKKRSGGADRTKTGSVNPNANVTTPTSVPGFTEDQTPYNAQTPTSIGGFYPMISPTSGIAMPVTRSPTSQPGFLGSPQRDPSLMWQGATGGGGVGFPPDLAVSPPHERWPGATAPGGVTLHTGGAGSTGPDRPATFDNALDAYSQQLTVPALLRRLYGLGGTGG